MKETIYNTFVSSSKINEIYKNPTQIVQLQHLLNQLVVYESDYRKFDMKILPNEFEPQNSIWKEYMTDPENQGECGSCWAFASSSCFSDRFNILLKTKYIDRIVSPTDLILCNDILNILLNENTELLDTIKNPFNLNEYTIQIACSGNSLICAFYYFKFYGVSMQKCSPYNSKNIMDEKITKTNIGYNYDKPEVSSFGSLQDLKNYTQIGSIANKTPPSCNLYFPYSYRPFNFCFDTSRESGTRFIGNPAQNFTSFLIYSVKDALKNTDYIRYEIYKWGPICSSFLVYEDFYLFDPINGGVYIHNSNNYNVVVGGHAIEIVGWGEYEMDGKMIPFWWVKNSWGVSYGFNGYFRFLRGNNQCEIENNIICMMPNLFFDFNNFKQIKSLNNQLIDLNIFYLIKPIYELFRLTKKIIYSITLSANSYNQIQFYNNYFNYGFFYYEVFINIGFYEIGRPLKTFYGSYNMLVFPGLDYSVSIKNRQIFKKDFYAAVATQEKSDAINFRLNYYFLFFFIFFIFLGVFLVLFIISYLTKNKIINK